MIPLACACGAFAATTGGVSAEGTTTTTAPGATTKSPLHLFPVTSRSRSVAYHGPVYERTASGQIVPYQPSAQPTASTSSVTTGTASSATGGSPPAASTTTAAPITPGVAAPKPQLLVPGTTARYVAGLAAAPMGAPAAVQQMIWAGNQLIGLPYIFGGGHASFIASGYDCSGTVSFALHGAALLASPKDSSEFETWGSHGIGRWVSIFSNPGHAYMTIAGLRLDTSAADDPSAQQGPRWRPLRTANSGYVVRHPLGL
jgi:cell wall-associated NlpC family hydrolase